MNKIKKTLLIGIVISAILLCFIDFIFIAINRNTADQVVREMGVGWNLANALCTYSTDPRSYETYLQKRNKYQLMATYATKPYSGWDNSSIPYFSTTSSTCELSWNISKLNSRIDLECKNFSFQIINNALIDTGYNPVDFTVTKAEFITAGGSKYVLSDIIGDYSIPINNKVTPHVYCDLTSISQLISTKDIIGGTLTIAVRINQYPMPISINTVSREHYFETLWGNPVTTKAMIDMVKEAGFKSIRIPVTFYNHMDEQGNIDEAWLERVSEVVQYALDNNMYCIINMHHDTVKNSWLKADMDTIDTTGDRFKTAWSQIAEYFKEYNQKLLFEGYNEILNSKNQWSGAGKDSYKVANQLNQIFVDTVRNTGGNNSKRHLVVNTYAAKGDVEIVNHFLLPKDSIENHLIVGVHYYGTSIKENTNMLRIMNAKFVSQGVPIILGEYGTNFEMNETDRIECAKHLVSTAKQYNIAVLWWDDGNYDQRVGAKANYALFDRVTLTWYHPNIAKALVESSTKK